MNSLHLEAAEIQTLLAGSRFKIKGNRNKKENHKHLAKETELLLPKSSQRKTWKGVQQLLYPEVYEQIQFQQRLAHLQGGICEDLWKDAVPECSRRHGTSWIMMATNACGLNSRFFGVKECILATRKQKLQLSYRRGQNVLCNFQLSCMIIERRSTCT